MTKVMSAAEVTTARSPNSRWRTTGIALLAIVTLTIVAGCGDSLELNTVAVPATELAQFPRDTSNAVFNEATTAAAQSLFPLERTFSTDDGYSFDLVYDNITLSTEVGNAPPGFMYAYATATGTMTNTTGAHRSRAIFPIVSAVFEGSSGVCELTNAGDAPEFCMTSAIDDSREWNPQVYRGLDGGASMPFSLNRTTGLITIGETAPLPVPYAYIIGINTEFGGGISGYQIAALRPDGSAAPAVEEWFAEIQHT